jgi:hypothetical protein
MCFVEVNSPTRIPVPSAVARVFEAFVVAPEEPKTHHEPVAQRAAAVGWHSRWCAESPGTGFAESRAALDALESLAWGDRSAAVQRLRSACGETEGVEEILDGWLAKRALSAD